MSEKIPQFRDKDENEEEESSSKKGSGALIPVVLAAAVAGNIVVGLDIESHNETKDAAEHHEAVEKQLPPELKADLDAYHSKIYWQSGTEVISATFSHDEAKARAVEIAIEKGISGFNEPVTFKQTKEGVPFDISIGTNFVPYSPDNYSPAELVSLKSEAEKSTQ